MAYPIQTRNGTLWVETCFSCKTTFAMSDSVHTAALERREKMSFFCPNGHSQVYVSGETEADELRRERDRLKQEQAYLNDRLTEAESGKRLAERRAAAAKGQVTKLKKRAAAGVCPCCNRTFSDLQRHMHSKHPGFLSEPDASEHVH